MTTYNTKKVPFTSSNDPVTKTIPPYQPVNAFIPGQYADLNLALGLFPPNAVNVQAKYYATSDIAKLDPNYANQERLGRMIETGVAIDENDPGLIGRISKTTFALGIVGALTLLLSMF